MIREREIVEHVGETYAERGRKYYDEGRVRTPRLANDRLSAKCWGSRPSPYEVEVEFDEQGVADSRCNCPVRTPCKHVAALLYTLLENPDAIAYRDRLRERMESVAQRELIEIVMELTERHPNAERYLERRLFEARDETSVDPSEIRSHAERAFQSEFERASGHGLEAVVANIVDQLERLAAVGTRHRHAGRPREALAVWASLAEVATNHDFEGGRELDELFAFLGDLQDEIVALLDELEADADRRWAFDVLWQIFELDLRHSGVDLARPFWEAVEHAANTEERAKLVDRAEERARKERRAEWPDRRAGRLLLRFVDTFGRDPTDTDRRVDDYEALGAVGDLVDTLLRADRVDEARDRTAEVEYSRDFVEALERFERRGHKATAEDLAKQRLADGEHDHAPQAWLVDHFVGEGRDEEALQVALEMLDQHPNAKVFERVELLARGLDRWDEIRPEAREVLREKAPRAYLQHLLADREIEEAAEFWRANWADRPHDAWRTSDVELELADHIDASHPEIAVEIWAQEVRALLETETPENIPRAAELLSRIRETSREANARQRWCELRDDLLQGHRHERKLAGALDDMGIPLD